MSARFVTGRCKALHASAKVRDSVFDTEAGDHARFVVDNAAPRVARLLNDQPELRDDFVWHEADDCIVESAR